MNFRDVFKNCSIEPTCCLLFNTFGLVSEVKYYIDTKFNMGFNVDSDILIVRDWKVHCTIKNHCSIIPSNKRKKTVIKSLSGHSTQALMRQLITQIVYYRITTEVLTDAPNAFLVETTVNYFEK
ncbi:unnamed protein product [Debaryomyces tyrocola]|nr:unnamed protein product [Debaryomyces tyrocola]